MLELIRRIIGIFSVSAAGQAINLVLRLVSMPLFLHFWGKDLYGEWLILLALPSYLAVSGSGVSNIAATDMAMNNSRGLQNESLRIFQSVWVFVTALSFLFVLAVGAAALTCPVNNWLNIRHIASVHFNTALVLLALYALFFLQGELLVGLFRASGKLVQGLLASNLIVLFENAALLAAVAVSSSVLPAIMVYLAVRMTGTVAMALYLVRTESWIRFGVREAEWKVVKSALLPSASYIGINVSNALIVQGMVTVIGVRLGSTAVVNFTAIRTLINLVKQFNSLIYYSVLPEFSTALATDNKYLSRMLHRYACQATLLFTVFNVAFLLLLGKPIIHLWTNGKLEIDAAFFTLMLVSMIPNTFYVTSSYVQVSINRLEKLALLVLSGSLLAIIAVYAAIPYIGMPAVPLALMLADSILLIVVVKDSLLLVGDRVGDFLQSMFAFDYLRKIRKLQKDVAQP